MVLHRPVETAWVIGNIVRPGFKLTVRLGTGSGLQRGGGFATLEGFQRPGGSSGRSLFLIADNANPYKIGFAKDVGFANRLSPELPCLL